MASTPLLGLALPADGVTNWGTLVNTSITALLDSAVAGTTTITSTSATYTLSITVDAANEARQAVILCTGARPGIQTIIAPAQSKNHGRLWGEECWCWADNRRHHTERQSLHGGLERQ